MQSPNHLAARAWVLRPVVWFATASMLTTISHELAHACVAFALGVRSTLYNYSANLDLTEAQSATNLPAVIRVAGPIFCLGAGALSWLALRRAPGSAAELPLLYLSVFGVATFFGNLMSTSFVGDFSSAAAALGLPMAARLAVTLVGALAVAAVHFWAGRQLIRWAPAAANRMVGMLGMIVAPVLLGTFAIILVSQPMRGTSMSARVAEASFWVFAAIAALLTRRSSEASRGGLELRSADVAFALLAVLTVRLMARGIPFVP